MIILKLIILKVKAFDALISGKDAEIRQLKTDYEGLKYIIAERFNEEERNIVTQHRLRKKGYQYCRFCGRISGLSYDFDGKIEGTTLRKYKGADLCQSCIKKVKTDAEPLKTGD